MDAVLRVQPSEFTDELVEKIKLLLRGKENSEITISITDRSVNDSFRKETREEYFARLENAFENLKKGNVVTFSGDAFEMFSKHLLDGE